MCSCQRLLATNCYFNHRLLCNLTYLVTREMTYSNLHHGRPILKMSSGCCSTERYWKRIRFNLYQTIICLNIIVSIKSLLFIGLHCTCVHATDFMEKDKDSHFAQFTIWYIYIIGFHMSLTLLNMKNSDLHNWKILIQIEKVSFVYYILYILPQMFSCTSLPIASRYPRFL